uniref:Transmembrane protein 65 n=1 Tax=Cacopsylla melanoneura TaxID=428564 RepID=A0A8D8YR16_9HEMI
MYLNRPLFKIPYKHCSYSNVIPYISKHISCVLLKSKLKAMCQQNVQLSTAQVFYQEESADTVLPLTKDRARELVMRLNVEERTNLTTTLQEIESDKMKDEYKGQLAAYRWRSKFGRPSRVPSLGDVDPTGSYCPLPEDWLYKKYAETIPKPTKSQLIALAVHNSIPFIGFGFLDNFFMITFGDSIESSMGMFMVISTMAAAALGNTLSDVLGIGLSSYVERGVMKLGFHGPNLSPIQLDMKTSRVFANLGRTLGVTIGCILGMTPLLFIKNKDADNKETENKTDLETGTD